MWIDQRGSEVLTRNECVRLLAITAGGVGRFGLVDAVGNVVIHPVNYGMLDGDVLIQVGPGSMLDAASQATIVSFEIDQMSRADGGAWSVLVHGLATVVTAGSRSGPALPDTHPPLVPEPGCAAVRIRTGILSGRRFLLRSDSEPPPAKGGTDR
jgi:uncharacterized protein